MERRIRYFEQLKDRFETIKEETVELESRKDTEDTEKKPVIEAIGKQEYIARVKSKLNAWTKELDRWETEASQADLNEECTATMVKLDQRLAEGFEKMRDLVATTDEDWDSIRENAETLWEDIMVTFDQVRHCAGGGV